MKIFLVIAMIVLFTACASATPPAKATSSQLQPISTEYVTYLKDPDTGCEYIVVKASYASNSGVSVTPRLESYAGYTYRVKGCTK